MITTNNDTGVVMLGNNKYQDGLVTFTGAATLKAGTILARNSTNGKFVPFVKGGTTNENGIPKAILTYDVTATAAGDKSARVAISGEFRKERLIIAADGTNANVDDVVRDALRAYGMVALNVNELYKGA